MKTILFVDDELWLVQGMVDALESAGYRVMQAADGTQAIQTLEGEERVDLIVLDIMMPTGKRIDDPTFGRRTGVQVCKIIREEFKLRTPIVFLTVVTDKTVHEQIRHIEKRAGCDPVIMVKPALPSELLDIVRSIIG